jgi:type I restriction enzyme S subunit
MVKLAEVAETALGKMLDAARPKGDLRVPYLRNLNVQWGRVDLADVLEVPLSSEERERFSLEEGDLLVCEGGEIGRAAIWGGGIPNMAYQKALHRVRSRGELDLRYLRYLLEHYAANGALAARATGSTIQHLPQQRLRELPVPLPDITVQTRIVDILEDHLSRLDAADAGLVTALERQASLRECVVRIELTGSEGCLRRDKAELEGAGVDDGSLPGMPAGWHWKRLHELADVVGGVTKDAKRQSDPTSVEVPYLRVANVQRGHLDLSTVSSIRVPQAMADKLRLMRGDVLLNEGGDRDKLGRGWVWEGQVERCIHQNHVFRARVRDSQLDPYLLSWAANSFGGGWCERNGRQSVNLASISLSKIKMMPVPVPPREQQRAVAQRIREVIDASLRLERDVVAARQRGTLLRRALLSATFAGQLT